MDGISHASAVSRFETVVTLQPGLDSNPEQRDLERKFVQAFKLACSTTVMGQTFYRREFDRAHSALQHAVIPDNGTDQTVQTGDSDLSFRHHQRQVWNEPKPSQLPCAEKDVRKPMLHSHP